MRYFYVLRSQVLKQGALPALSAGIYIGRFDTTILQRLPRPPGATAFFMGDSVGGSGWEVPLPDGSTEKYYVDLPPEVGYSFTLGLPESPSLHLGKEVRDKSVQNLAGLYLAFLGELLNSAETEYGVQQ